MADEEQPATEPTEAEIKARETGWVPKEEFKGKPEFWKPAELWLEQAPKSFIPKLEKKIGELERKLAEQATDFNERVKRLDKASQAALKAQKERLEADFEARKEKAVETGDTESYRKIATEQKAAMAKLDDKAEAAEVKQTKAGSDLPPEVVKRLETWLEDNDWYGKAENKRLARKFDSHYVDVEEDMPLATIMERLEESKKRLIEQFPEKFGKKPKEEDEVDDEPRRARVEGGSRTNGSGVKQKSWQAIPAADRDMAKQVLEAFLKKGETMEANLAQVRERYAIEYWKDQAA